MLSVLGCIRPISLLTVLAAATLAQVPAGWAVVSSFRVPPNWNAPGVGGLWLVHPLAPAPATPITGLPPWITGCQWPSAAYTGMDFVLRLPDGRLVTNGYPWPVPATPVAMQIGIIALSGTAVASVQTYSCGTLTAASYLGVPQAALLPGGTVLLSLDRVGAPGEHLYNHTLAILDPAAPPGPTNPAAFPLGGWTPASNQAVNALCIDPSGLNAWFATTQTSSGLQSHVYRVSLTAPGSPPVLIASLSNVGIRTLAFDRVLGSLLVGGYGAGNLYRCHPLSGALTPVAFPMTLNAVVVEPSTGALLLATSNPSPEAVWRLAPGAVSPTLLSAGAPGGFAGCTGFATGWAALSGIDVAPALEILGPGVPGSLTSYDWDLTPSPNALPYAGNPSFGLTLRSTGGAVGGVIGVSLAALPMPLILGAGIPIYIDPNTLILLHDLPAGAMIPFGPFALPPSFAGTSIYLQSLHYDGAASSGLKLTFL